ncbi:MAG: proline dehydrogenase family protein [Chitinophagaceae bacterium]|jgi:proline dehydrogenase|nr:proline dehydrogenase family protein [Chitinophagaceae bacterium]
MKILEKIDFDDTKTAFAYMSDRQLKLAHLLFASMNMDWLVNLGLKITPWAINNKLPVKGLIKATIFEHFVGGETLSETVKVAEKLSKSNVQAILDYGVEGKDGEENFDQACEEFIRVIKHAALQPGIPYMSVKVTGLARFALLEKLDAAATENSGYNGKVHTEILTPGEVGEWERVVDRLYRIAAIAYESNVGVLIDAEDSWIQDPVDALTMQMMKNFNRQKAVVFNTFQLYRHDRLQFLKDSFEKSVEEDFILGAKLVRGAYLEKERERAVQKKYPSPIQPDKESTDKDYNLAIKFCMEHLDRISLVVASHNEYSNLYTVQLLQEKDLPLDHPRVHFSQLYGMSDNITFNLAKAGCSVSKYLPFGPIKDVIPYLMRRAQENSSVKGQTGRELGLIKKELKRRKEK